MRVILTIWIPTFVRMTMNFVQAIMVPFSYLFRRAVTVQYPDEKIDVPANFRGILVNDISKCIVCEQCAMVCPVDCFEMDYVKGEGYKGAKRVLTRYEIQIGKCVFCGLCAEACPTQCLTMTGGYEASTYTREGLLYHHLTKEQADDVRAKWGSEEIKWGRKANGHS